MSERTVLILSGGMDSATMLYWLRYVGKKVDCLGVDYGQKHGRELSYAEALCGKVGVSFRVADLRALRPILAGSSQTDDSVPVPEGHYAEESMKLTVVPNRNMIMLAVAAGYAISLKADSVAYAAHAGDHAIYPDCRPEFADALGKALALCDWSQVRLDRPFLGMTKSQIVEIGAKLGVPFQDTWSCYNGRDLHCGKCGTCTERREAFQLARVADPTLYEAA